MMTINKRKLKKVTEASALIFFVTSYSPGAIPHSCYSECKKQKTYRANIEFYDIITKIIARALIGQSAIVIVPINSWQNRASITRLRLVIYEFF